MPGSAGSGTAQVVGGILGNALKSFTGGNPNPAATSARPFNYVSDNSVQDSVYAANNPDEVMTLWE
jgi:hypothetical protein